MAKSSVSTATFLTRLFVVGIGLVFVLDQFGARTLLGLDAQNGSEGTINTAYWINLIAPIFYLAALWCASSVFARLDRGEGFESAVVRALSEMGFCLMIGGFISFMVAPAIIHLIGNGFTEMRGVAFDYRVENFTLMIAGLVFVLIAQRGRRMKRELEEFI